MSAAYRHRTIRPPRVADDAPQSAFGRLTGLVGRTLGLGRTRQDGVTLRDASAVAMCEELRARLLGLADDRAAQVMKHLVLVHDVLVRFGWPGVAGLPGRVLGRALLQAEILASEEPSPTLEQFVDRLRIVQVAATQRDEDDHAVHEIRIGQNLEVTESTHAEFDVMARQWGGTVPSELSPDPERDRA